MVPSNSVSKFGLLLNAGAIQLQYLSSLNDCSDLILVDIFFELSSYSWAHEWTSLVPEFKEWEQETETTVQDNKAASFRFVMICSSVPCRIQPLATTVNAIERRILKEKKIVKPLKSIYFKNPVAWSHFFQNCCHF